MPQSPTRSRSSLPLVRPYLALGLGLILAVCTMGDGARAEPPIRGAQDAACRNEARSRVFSTPNPRGLSPEVVGRQIYTACMRRSGGKRARRR